MKKLYNKKGKVHPSPPPSTPDPFALLPATILTLTTALSVQDREVLSYLISYTNNNSTNIYTSKKARVSHEAGKDHPDPPMSQCDCFRCYTSFWARWDASPNRQLIHEIIEAYEEKLAEKKRRNPKVKKVRKNKVEEEITKGNNMDNLPAMKEELDNNPEVDVESCDGDEEEGRGVEIEKASMRSRLVSFIWGVWN
uniref:uncharacterized protein LOC105352404 n=1 Tax=Fragaria vesca subsp. vesca TaxID=101020 RepID=UPI0005CAB78F|nr:PREDICTED: uncharacterized protein LOC105352404 [Fragaria vesca subsp. vesca]